MAGGVDDGLVPAERALALDANLAEAHAVKARILSQHGRHDEAAAEIDVALRLDPESYEVNSAAAYLRFSQQRLAEAVRYYEKSMTLMETDLNSGSMLLTCYTAMGNSQAASRVAQITLSRYRKDLGAGSEQWDGHGLRCHSACDPGGGRTRQGLDQSCAAD